MPVFFTDKKGTILTQIAVIYHSVTGTTRGLGEAIAEGARSVPGTSAIILAVKGGDILEGRYSNNHVLSQLEQTDAIVFGSPTFMGTVSAQFKAFADATSEYWEKQSWANKIAAGFTIGSNFSGDQLHAVQYLQIFANQHGMLWVGLDIPGNSAGERRNRLGAQSGLIAHSPDGTLNAADCVTAHYLGQRVAQTAHTFKAGRQVIS
jgi:NAD(P)H dehydrogenase (quinone)